MHTSARLGLTALAAALLLSAAVGTASAGRLSVNSPNFRVTWKSLELTNFPVVRCLVTLEGSFHSRSIVKTERALIGAITRVTVKRESCTGGEILGRRETLPWHLTYEGFAGTLPNITAVNLLLSRFRFLLTIEGLCNFGEYGTATDNITLRATVGATGRITGLEPVEPRNVATRVAPQELCPEIARLRNAEPGVVTALNSAATIVVQLI